MEINSIDLHGDYGDKSWSGITHNITIVKLCLNHISHNLTSNISDQGINKQQGDSDAKDNILNVNKKSSLRLVKKTFALISELESYTQSLNTNGNSVFAQTSAKASDKVNDVIFRSSLIHLMATSLKCWEQNTGGNKIDFAEKSKLWRVSVDNGQVRVRTMDSYLDIDKLPRVPRKHQVFKTAYFVLNSSKSKLPIRKKLEKALSNTLERERKLSLV